MSKKSYVSLGGVGNQKKGNFSIFFSIHIDSEMCLRIFLSVVDFLWKFKTQPKFLNEVYRQCDLHRDS